MRSWCIFKQQLAHSRGLASSYSEATNQASFLHSYYIHNCNPQSQYYVTIIRSQTLTTNSSSRNTMHNLNFPGLQPHLKRTRSSKHPQLKQKHKLYPGSVSCQNTLTLSYYLSLQDDLQVLCLHPLPF